MYLSREEILKVYDAGPDAVVALVQDLCLKYTMLEERVANLERIIAKDSHNSHKPPSSDGFKTPKPKSRRERSGLPPGGQKGHEGHTLEMANKPDRIEWHRVDRCCNCHHSLKDVKAKEHDKRQEFDIPPSKINVVEHRAEIKDCPYCGHTQKADFPANIQQPVQYGSGVKSLAVYLNNYQFVPYERMSDLFKDVFSLPISQGTLVNINKNCYDRLENFEAIIKNQLANAKVVNFDETGLRMEGKGKGGWLHSASTPFLTLYIAHSKRGVEAMEDINILSRFKGTAIHDCWMSYFDYMCKHGLCNTHLVRELIFTDEEYHQAWAQNMIDCLLDIKDRVEEKKQIADSLEKKKIKEYEKRFDRIIVKGLKQNPSPQPQINPCQKKRGKTKQSQPKNLLDRMKKHKEKVLAFMYDFNVPFDNNLAERDIRMTKIKQKISGTFRSRDGANIFCRIRSYISTVRKNSRNVLESVRKAIDGNPFMPRYQTSGTSE